MKKYILFDCDGVLVDSEIIAAQVLGNMLIEHGIPASVEVLVRDFAGRKDHEIVAHFFKIASRHVPSDFMHALEKALDAELEKRLVHIPGIDGLLTQISAVPRAIVSNSPMVRIHTSLATTKLAHFFDSTLIFTADMAGVAKPDPGIYHFALNRLEWNKEEVVVVEDSPTGVAAAVGAGLHVIGFSAASHIRSGHAEKLLQAGAVEVVNTAEELYHCLSYNLKMAL